MTTTCLGAHPISSLLSCPGQGWAVTYQRKTLSGSSEEEKKVTIIRTIIMRAEQQ